MAFMAWHHRKDGVFTSFQVLAILGVGLGWPQFPLLRAFSLAKFLLLGGAAAKMTTRCLKNLRCPDEGLVQQKAE